MFAVNLTGNALLVELHVRGARRPISGACRPNGRKGGFTASGGTACRRQYGTPAWKPIQSGAIRALSTAGRARPSGGAMDFHSRWVPVVTGEARLIENVL